MENIDFGVDLGSLLEAFLVQKSYQKSGAKTSEEQIGKKWFQGGPREFDRRPRGDFCGPSCLLGGRGV